MVCVKQVLDPELPMDQFQIHPDKKHVFIPNVSALTITDYDEVAVEAAIRIKEKIGAKVIVLTMGDRGATKVLRHCMAMGADEGVLVSDSAFTEEDRAITAYVLARAIEKIGDVDLVLCGRQEADWNGGVVHYGIAHFLGVPCCVPVKAMEVQDRIIRVQRIKEDVIEILDVSLPCVLGVDTEYGEPRLPTTKGILEASRRPLLTWNSQALGVEPGHIKKNVALLELFVPVLEVSCEFIQGDTVEEKAKLLAKKLRENLVL